MAIQVALADRAGTSRHALADLLRRLPDVRLTGTAGDAAELGALLQRCPDVLIVDDRLLGEDLPACAPATRLIVMGMDDDPRYALRARRAGAVAWIAKDRAAELLPGLLAAPSGGRGSRDRGSPAALGNVRRHRRPAARL